MRDYTKLFKDKFKRLAHNVENEVVYILDDSVVLRDANDIYNYHGSEVVIFDTVFHHLNDLVARNFQIKENFEHFINETQKGVKVTLIKVPTDVHSDDFMIQFADDIQQKGQKKKVIIVTEDMVLNMKASANRIETIFKKQK